MTTLIDTFTQPDGPAVGWEGDLLIEGQRAVAGSGTRGGFKGYPQMIQSDVLIEGGVITFTLNSNNVRVVLDSIGSITIEGEDATAGVTLDPLLGAFNVKIELTDSRAGVSINGVLVLDSAVTLMASEDSSAVGFELRGSVSVANFVANDNDNLSISTFLTTAQANSQNVSFYFFFD